MGKNEFLHNLLIGLGFYRLNYYNSKIIISSGNNYYSCESSFKMINIDVMTVIYSYFIIIILLNVIIDHDLKKLSSIRLSNYSSNNLTQYYIYTPSILSKQN